MNKYLLLTILIILSGCSENSEQEKENPPITVGNVEKLEKRGFELFQNSPTEAVSIFKQVASEYVHLKNSKKAGITNLNIANIYDERLNQLDSALVYSKKSLQIWQGENDSLQMANLCKYVGLIEGKLGNYQEAKTSIDEAIKLYQYSNFPQGIAVSEINLSEVNLREGNVQKSELLYLSSTKFWKTKKEMSRIFSNNILGIEIYTKVGNEFRITELIEENRRIGQENNINSFVKNKFEELIKKVETNR